MTSHRYGVILAGGGGTRLWPLSRRDQPKQLLPIIQGRTLYELTLERIAPLFPPENIYIVTVDEQAKSLQRLSCVIPPENFLIEPMAKGTASAAGFAAGIINQRDPHGIMALLPADHLISNKGAFTQLMNSGLTAAEEGGLITLGIHAAYPSTGYGYIQESDVQSSLNGISIRRVIQFKEKPSVEQAEGFLRSGGHYWNSGMFIWKAAYLLSVIDDLMPELGKAIQRIIQDWDSPQRDLILRREWESLTAQTVDYGIMEKAKNVFVLPASDFGWSDVGSWESLMDNLPVDKDGNITMDTDPVLIECEDTLVIGSNKKKLIAGIGLSDMVIIDTEDALLVCPKDRAQQVRKIVDLLRKNDQVEYL